MKLVRYPCVVRLYEVKFLAGRTNIYILLEYNTCGELFIELFVMNVLVKQKLGRVYHRDLKPGKLLLDSQGNLKISDYGLSALPERGVTILKTTCGTPNYVVLSHKGYNGVVADVWSCGVILYVLSHNS
ncbi:BnaA09g26440D [Brassica napus]|uniref:BnaA09g26440D protein n=1 Tax=Brassica napus TaxID=3708 RepID=A0A078GNR9_BRANA|nr:BnaA09g26440D [Brassica napus]